MSHSSAKRQSPPVMAWRLYRDAFAGLPTAVWTLAFVLLVHRSGTMVLPFLALHLKDHLGTSGPVAAQLMSVYGVGSVLGAILGGRLTARYGALPMMAAALLFTTPIFILLLFAKSLASAAASIFALAVIGDMVRPAGMTATTELCDAKDLSRAFALTRLAINLGMSIGPAMAGLLYANHFELIFVFDAATCLIAALLIAWLFPLKQSFCSAASNRRPQAEVASSATVSKWQLVAVLALFGSAMLFFLQLIGTFPIYLREEHQLTEAQIGLLFSVNTGLIVLFEMVLIRAIDGLPRVPVIAFGAVLILLGFGILPLGSGGVFIFATVCIWTVGEMLSMPILSTWVSETSRPKDRSKNLSYVTATFSLGWVFAPILGGAAYSVDVNLFWYIGLAYAPILAIAFFWVNQSVRPTAR